MSQASYLMGFEKSVIPCLAFAKVTNSCVNFTSVVPAC